jgi:hypothetical protein
MVISKTFCGGKFWDVVDGDLAIFQMVNYPIFREKVPEFSP